MLQGMAMEDGPDDLVGGVPTPNRNGNASSEEPPPFDENGYALDDRWIGRGCTFIRQAPRTRLSECLEAISPSLEAGFTAECTSNGLLALLWVYTRCKPCVKFVDLRALAHNQRNNTIVYLVSVRLSYLRTSKLSVSQVFDDSGSSTRP